MAQHTGAKRGKYSDENKIRIKREKEKESYKATQRGAWCEEAQGEVL